MNMTRGGWQVWAGLVMTVASGVAAAGEGHEVRAPSAAEVVADMREVNRRFSQERYAEALALLDALAARLGEARHQESPFIEVTRGRCLEQLDRRAEALQAYERTLAWIARSSKPHEAMRAEAQARRAALVGELTVDCEGGVERVRLPVRDEVRACPAHWSAVLAGRVRVEPIEPDGQLGRVRSVDVTAGASSTVLVEADPNTRWRLGLRLGGGAASILDETVYVVDPRPGSSVRLAGALGSPWIAGWLSGQLELGVSRNRSTYTDTGAIDGAVPAGATPQDTALTAWQLEAAAMARACRADADWSVCLLVGGGAAALLDAEWTIGGVSYTAETGRDQAHVLVRGGLEVEWSRREWAFVAGPHVAYSPWPGAIQYQDGRRHSTLRAWLDVGVSVCTETVCW